MEIGVTSLEILKRARLRIAEKGRWCAGVPARNGRGVECRPDVRAAVQWCAAGAVLCEVSAALAWAGPCYLEAMRRLDGAAVRLGVDPLLAGEPRPAAVINDRGDHALVLRMFDEAIGSGTGGGTA